MGVAADGNHTCFPVDSQAPSATADILGEEGAHIIATDGFDIIGLLTPINGALNLVDMVAYDAAIVKRKK